MTAKDSVRSAEAYDRAFRVRAHRCAVAGLAVVIAAGLLWLWFLGQLLLGYEAEAGLGAAVECDALVSREPDAWKACVEERDWPSLLLLGGVAGIVSVVGAALLVYGRALLRISQHREKMAALPPT